MIEFVNFDITLGIMRELGNRLRDTNQHVYDLTFLDAGYP